MALFAAPAPSRDRDRDSQPLNDGTTEALRSQVAAKWGDAFARLNRAEPGIQGLMEFSQAWGMAKEYLRPRDIMNPADVRPEYNISLIRHAFDLVGQSRRLPVLLEGLIEQTRQAFPLVERTIQYHLQVYEATEPRDPRCIAVLVQELRRWYEAWLPWSELGVTICGTFTLHFHTCLFAALPPGFITGFKHLCQCTLPRSDDVAMGTSDNNNSSSGDAIGNDATPWTNPTHFAYRIWDTFDVLGMLDRYETVIASVGYEYIESVMRATCAGVWSRAVMPDLRRWVAGRIKPWLRSVYAKDIEDDQAAMTAIQTVSSRFDFHVAKTLCDLRISELFDIIIDYPDSAPCLDDIKECLVRVDGRASLVRSLRKANRKRLLHPGADTRLILQQYVLTIKCLRVIDPQGVLLFKVADPIRRYLRERPDTIRCIVANLVGGSGDSSDDEDDILGETEPPVPLHQAELEDYTDPNWEPEPLDAGPDFRANRPADVISTLVSIYDSRDLFVKELQVLLAQRLLKPAGAGGGGSAVVELKGAATLEGTATKGKEALEGTAATSAADTDAMKKAAVDAAEKERRNVEILKIRFGDAALQVCEVMLKDMGDSRRTDVHVQGQVEAQAENLGVLHPTIISRHFWPAVEGAEFKLPGQFERLQESYAKQYTLFKPDKKLRWLPHLGTVSLELELEDRTLRVQVPPLEAAFIELFGEQDKWTVTALIHRLGKITRPAALKALLTWVNLGVLKETSGADGEEGEEETYVLLERAESDANAGAGANVRRLHAKQRMVEQQGMGMGGGVEGEGEEEEERRRRGGEEGRREMDVYWKFIQGMLTNLPNLPLERIHAMLGFVDTYNLTTEQLAGLLDAARREGLVDVKEGLWKLVVR